MTGRQDEHKAQRERGAAVVALLTGALIWGLIWYPYRILRDAGVDAIVATTGSYTLAFFFALFLFRRTLTRPTPSWTLFWLALSAAGCNLGYVLGTLSGDVMRVLLLFYLAPLWTVLLSRWLLHERLNRYGVFVVALSLAGAVTMLWRPQIGWPVPRNVADWYGLGAGFSFALFNVLSRYAKGLAIETKVTVSFVGVIAVGLLLIVFGYAQPLVSFHPSSGLLLVLIGLVLLAANVVVQYGLARVAANRAIVIMLSEVGFAALASWLLADEVLGLREWVGGALIVLASFFSARMESPKRQP